MKSKVWNLTKNAPRSLPWTWDTFGREFQVMDPSKMQVHVKSQIPGATCSHLASPLWRTESHIAARKNAAGARSLYRLQRLCPPFLISALLVFYPGRDSMRKRAFVIDVLTRFRRSFRRLIDIVVALISLILTAPLFVSISVLIKLDSPGPVIYKQVRVGQNRRHGDRRKNCHRLKGDRRNGDRRQEDNHGQLFVSYKFRSMREDAEKKIGPVQAQKGDPRVTKVGQPLRATHLDQLPQLLNILKGDMSLVGPKSERPYFVSQFVNSISQYRERLKVKPGLIEVAQAIGGQKTCPNGVLCKLS